MIRFGTREAIFLGVLMAMPASSYWFVFKPQNQEIAEAREEINHKELMLEQLDKATAQTENLSASNQELSDAIELVESRLPGTKEVEVVLEQVAELARQSKLDLNRVKAGKPVAAARYMEQPLDMEIKGDFDDFYTFLLAVERLERITRMGELELKRDEKDDGVMNAKFTLSIYFEPAAAPAAAVAEVAQ